jgi:formate hydrogenlyase transcriptional activator
MWGTAAQPIQRDLLQRYQALLEVSDVIHSFRNLDELFRELSQCLRRVVAFDAIAIALLDEDQQTLRLGPFETFVQQSVGVGFTVPSKAVPGGWVMENQKILRVRTRDGDPRFKLHNESLGSSGLEVSYHLPLTTSLTRLGELAFAFKDDGINLPEYELQFMQRVADQVALAIENALNFDEVRRAHLQLERKNKQRQLLLEITNNVVSNLELKEVLQAVASSVRQVVSAALVAVALPDETGTRLRIEALEAPGGKGLLTKGLSVPIVGSVAGKCFLDRTPITNRGIDPENYTPEMYHRVMGEGLLSQCFVPFVSRGQSLGVIGIARSTEDGFSAEEIEFLQHVASQITIGLENAFNYETARQAERDRKQERDRLQLLMDLTNHLANNLELPDLLQAVATSVRDLMQCDIVTVHLPSPDRKTLKAYALDFPGTDWELKALHKDAARIRRTAEERHTPVEGSSLHGQVFRTGKPISTPRLDPSEFPLEAKFLTREGLAGGCVVPMILRGRVVGNLALGRREEKAFTEDEVEFLMQFGAQVAVAIENALAYREISDLKERLAQEKLYLEDEIRSEINFEEIIGQTPGLRAALKRVETVAPSDATVLILGETGTGKELVARAIHEASRRKGKTFVKLNCAAIPTGLLESELFGHERGAFTGAIAQKVGRMELANGGTLFLDEVGDIPLELQPKLLRALQEREFERLGGVRTQKVDVRFLAATHRNLQEMIGENQFRSDLFYRLNVFPITIPPLRERKDDIPRLIRYFVSKHAKKMDKQIETIPAQAMSKLQAWHWPGNVRELENFVERSVILTSGPVLHVPLTELESADGEQYARPVITGTLRDSEREYIMKALKECNGMIAGPNGAAARLGLKRTTLQSKMKKLGLSKDSYQVN